MKGDEVVQLYISHEGIDYAPIAALKAFKRITLNAGASMKVSFPISANLLKLVNEEGNSVFTPGTVKIVVGGSSPGKRSEELGAAKPVEAILTLK